MVEAPAGGTWAKMHEFGGRDVVWAVGGVAGTCVGAWFRLEDDW